MRWVAQLQAAKIRIGGKVREVQTFLAPCLLLSSMKKRYIKIVEKIKERRDSMGWMKEAIAATKRNDPAARTTLEIVLTYPGFHAIFWHRW